MSLYPKPHRDESQIHLPSTENNDTIINMKKYILTNSCYWYGGKGRTPHYIEIVDMETGETKYLKSGSLIQVVKARWLKK